MERARPIRGLSLGIPIAGSENSGVGAANPELFDGREVILTPSSATDTAALKIVERLWVTAGARVTHMSVEDHDAALAASSHVPHMVAYALTSMLADHELSAHAAWRWCAPRYDAYRGIRPADVARYCFDQSRRHSYRNGRHGTGARPFADADCRD